MADSCTALGPAKCGTRGHARLLSSSPYLFCSLGLTPGERQTGVSHRKNLAETVKSQGKEKQPSRYQSNMAISP